MSSFDGAFAFSNVTIGLFVSASYQNSWGSWLCEPQSSTGVDVSSPVVESVRTAVITGYGVSVGPA